MPTASSATVAGATFSTFSDRFSNIKMYDAYDGVPIGAPQKTYKGIKKKLVRVIYTRGFYIFSQIRDVEMR